MERWSSKRKWTKRVSLGSSLTGNGLLTENDVAAAKHAAFVRARGRHYSNEAEAMKVITVQVVNDQ